MPEIRKARCGDARQLSLLAERTFRDTFGAMNTPADMERHCQSSFSALIQADEIANPDIATLLSEHQGELIGFAQLRWGDAPACVVARSPGEILRLYVANDWHGQGVAQALIAACIEAMKCHGSDVAWLGVWERNPRAIAFYRKFGFVEAGEHVFLLGSDAQRDLVMTRAIDALSGG